MTLAARIEALLGDSLGALSFFGGSSQRQGPRWPPWLVGLVSGLGYATIFCLLPWLSGSLEQKLLWLSVWGSCYLAFAVTIDRHTSAVVLRQVNQKVIPWLSDSSSRAIDANLARAFNQKRVWLVSLAAAIVAVLTSVAAVMRINTYFRSGQFGGPLVISGCTFWLPELHMLLVFTVRLLTRFPPKKRTSINWIQLNQHL